MAARLLHEIVPDIFQDLAGKAFGHLLGGLIFGKGFDPNEERDDHGRWTEAAGMASPEGSGAYTAGGNGQAQGVASASDEDVESDRGARAGYEPHKADAATINQWLKDNAAAEAAKDENSPVFKPMNDIGAKMVAKRFPDGYDVSDTAPNTFEALKAHVEKTGRMAVWSGASGKTIFGTAQANYDFRAWHDAVHLAGNHPFTPEGELGAFNDMVKDVHEEADHTPAAKKTISLMHEEIIGQLTYGQHHGGEFPVNQRAFAAAYLSDPESAVKADFSKGLADRHQPGGPGGWGRFRDVPPGSDIAAMIAAALKKKT